MKITDDFLYQNMPKAENEILNLIPDEHEIEHKFSWKFKRKMKIIIKEQARTPKTKVLIMQIKKIAAIFIITISIVFSGIMSVEAYRIRFFNMIKEVWSELTSIVFWSNNSTNVYDFEPVSPLYIPNGYEIVEQWQNEYENVIIYSDKDNNEIVYTQQLIAESEYIFDSENTEIKVMNMNNIQVNILTKNNITQVYWTYEKSIFFISGKYENQIIRMVESFIKK